MPDKTQYDTSEVDITNRMPEQIEKFIHLYRDMGWTCYGPKKNNLPGLPALVLIFRRKRQEKNY